VALTSFSEDVAFLSYFTGLSSLASVAQQIHTIARWRDIKTEQYYHSVTNVGNPELAVAGPSTGLDLVLFYIRECGRLHILDCTMLTFGIEFYSYGVESLLVLFWFVHIPSNR
jgi:hypothetical protein